MLGQDNAEQCRLRWRRDLFYFLFPSKELVRWAFYNPWNAELLRGVGATCGILQMLAWASRPWMAVRGAGNARSDVSEFLELRLRFPVSNSMTGPSVREGNS